MTQASRVAKRDANVFIVGETGTGKELIAQSIYSDAQTECSGFVAINCSTIPESLADTILFGSVKGAYTGSQNTEGLFAEADGGILFLDEINSLNLTTQARLLRVLQEGAYMKVGSTKVNRCSVRVISSCNLDPWELMEKGTLRQDLFYRLTNCIIEVPPLRERKRDIALLSRHFLQYYCKKFAKNIFMIDKELELFFAGYRWPGNVRELKNVMEHAVSTCDHQHISIKHIPKYLRNQFEHTARISPAAYTEALLPSMSLTELVDNFEKELITHTMEDNGNNITRAADQLRVSRQALQYKIRKYNIN